MGSGGSWHTRRLIAERSAGDLQRIRNITNNNVHLGSHTGKQQEIVIIRGCHNCIGYYTLLRMRRLSYLGNATGEGSVRISIYRKRDVLANAQLPDVGLVHRDLDIHGAKITDGKQGRRLETGGNRLARGDAAINYNTAHRRPYYCAVQISFGLVKRCLTAPDLSFGMGYAGARDRQLSLRFLDPSLLGCHLGLGRG